MLLSSSLDPNRLVKLCINSDFLKQYVLIYLKNNRIKGAVLLVIKLTSELYRKLGFVKYPELSLSQILLAHKNKSPEEVTTILLKKYIKLHDACSEIEKTIEDEFKSKKNDLIRWESELRETEEELQDAKVQAYMKNIDQLLQRGISPDLAVNVLVQLTGKSNEDNN